MSSTIYKSFCSFFEHHKVLAMTIITSCFILITISFPFPVNAQVINTNIQTDYTEYTLKTDILNGECIVHDTVKYTGSVVIISSLWKPDWCLSMTNTENIDIIIIPIILLFMLASLYSFIAMICFMCVAISKCRTHQIELPDSYDYVSV